MDLRRFMQELSRRKVWAYVGGPDPPDPDGGRRFGSIVVLPFAEAIQLD